MRSQGRPPGRPPPGRFTTKALVERFHKGLLKKFEILGPGRLMFDPELPKPGITEAGNDICQARFCIRYVIDADRSLVRIYSSWHIKDGGWRRYHYSNHYGPEAYNESECYYRVDLDSDNGYHVHLPPNVRDHVPAAEVDPETKEMDPLTFVERIATFRASKVEPFTRKIK